jgi:dienelactone hydrolase
MIGVDAMRPIRALLLALLTLPVAPTPLHAAPPERVAIPTAGLSNSTAPLVGHVFLAEPPPAGTTALGAVVMLHGCGGAYARDGSLNARHRMWGEFLAGQGYAVLMLDSFSSRGVEQICTQKFGDRSLKEADRVGDAQAALAYAGERFALAPRRIALLGWSHGGGTVLATMAAAPRPEPGYAAAIAFYPGCSARAQAPDRFHPYAPLLLLVGEADDWTPAEPCHRLADALAARGDGALLELVGYPDTFHDFDNPALSARRVRPEVPNGVHPGQGVTIAPNPAAREDAKQRVLRFLAQRLGS